MLPPGQPAPVRASQRVAGILAERIASGLYAAGEQLPTERALAEDLHVHRRVVRTAIDQLERDGLVFQRPHCRPTVGARPQEQDVDTGTKAPPRLSASNLVALIMWHGGGPLEHAGTSQQRIFWGMNQSLAETGRHAVFLDIGGGRIGTEEENAAREAAHLRYVLDNGFGGVIFYPYAYRSNRELVKEVNRNIPLVLLDRKLAGVEADFVGVENHDSIFEMTRQLLSQGHRRIAYLTNCEPIHSVQDRIQGYVHAIRQADSFDTVETILTIPPFYDDRAWGVVDAVFKLPEGQRPTAAVCFTDYTAVGLVERLEYLGLSVPGDVAVTGFDDIVPALPGGMGLTTAAQPYEDIGSKAVELLLRRMEDFSAPVESVELPARLAFRESSAGSR